MITDELLLENGYREFDPVPLYGEYYAKSFQKKFYEGDKKKYFIEFRRWEFPMHSEVEVHFEGFAQLYAKGTHNAIDVTFHSGWTLEEVEEYVEKIYRLGFEPYDEDEEALI